LRLDTELHKELLNVAWLYHIHVLSANENQQIFTEKKIQQNVNS
jgi:hypothetical protein